VSHNVGLTFRIYPLRYVKGPEVKIKCKLKPGGKS